MQPSEFDFEMEHGVTKVWTDSSRKTVLAETPGNSYEFFVDMHRCALPPQAVLLTILLTNLHNVSQSRTPK